MLSWRTAARMPTTTDTRIVSSASSSVTGRRQVAPERVERAGVAAPLDHAGGHVPRHQAHEAEHDHADEEQRGHGQRQTPVHFSARSGRIEKSAGCFCSGPLGNRTSWL
jgi:hypothetical protein